MPIGGETANAKKLDTSRVCGIAGPAFALGHTMGIWDEEGIRKALLSQKGTCSRHESLLSTGR